MQETLIVNGIECKTVVIEGKWHVIVNEKPCKLYRGWRKGKNCRVNGRWVTKLKYKCIVCGEENFGQLNRPRKYCSKSCFGKVNSKALNARHIKLSEDNVLKSRAKSFIDYEVGIGKIERLKICSNCCCYGMMDGHHPNYDKFNEVIWLCRSCHKKLHFGDKSINGKLIVYDVKD